MKLRRVLASALVASAASLTVPQAANADASFMSSAKLTFAFLGAHESGSPGSALAASDFSFDVLPDGEILAADGGAISDGSFDDSGFTGAFFDEIIISGSTSGASTTPATGVDEETGSVEATGLVEVENLSGVDATLSFSFTYEFDVETSVTSGDDTASAEAVMLVLSPDVDLVDIVTAIMGTDPAMGAGPFTVPYSVDIADGDISTVLEVLDFFLGGGAMSLADVAELPVSEPPIAILILGGLLAFAASRRTSKTIS
jgi:hypothetical protein